MALRITSATERALERVTRGEAIGKSADAEGIARSTLFRALARSREGGGAAAHGNGRTLIVGAGALGRELANWIRRSSDGAAPVAFLDEAPDLRFDQIKAEIANGLARFAGNQPADDAERWALRRRLEKEEQTYRGELAAAADRGVAGKIEASNVLAGDVAFLAINDPKGRAAIAQRLSGIVLRTYVDPAAVVHGARLGSGSLLLPNSLVSDEAELGQHVVMNTFSSVGHDCSVDDFTTLSSYVGLCGRVRIGKRVFLGIGALVLPDVTIGDDAVIGAGAVVVKDVAAGMTVFGNPARAIA